MEYFEIPFADQALPVMSAWENKQAKERLRREGLKNPTQRDMLRGLTELRELAETSKKHTKKARRQVQRRKEHAKGISPANPFPQERNPLVEEPLAADLADGDIEPFGVIE